MREKSLNYPDVLGRLYRLARGGEKYGLDATRALNDQLSDPLSSYRSVLVGGTNGKGSTSAILDALLQSAGYRVGRFTSPHLISFAERIKIQGTSASQSLICEVAQKVLPLAESNENSFFEATWAMAAEAFKRAQVDIVVWEVGLGGRLDSTNVCEPIGSIVTNVALDHQSILGSTRRAIAFEKAAIFRPGRPAVTGCAESINLLQEHTDARVQLAESQTAIKLPLRGAHQLKNASAACSLLDALHIDYELSVLQSLQEDGKMEQCGQVWVDTAHNPHALVASLQALRKVMVEHPGDWVVGFGAMADKDVKDMAVLISELSLPVYLIEPVYPRRMPLAELADFFDSASILGQGSVPQFLHSRQERRHYFVLGSSFLVGEVLAGLRGIPYPECGILSSAR